MNFEVSRLIYFQISQGNFPFINATRKEVKKQFVFFSSIILFLLLWFMLYFGIMILHLIFDENRIMLNTVFMLNISFYENDLKIVNLNH